MSLPLPSLAVANYFVGKSLDTGVELTPMKLIKLVYIAHGWHLALRKEALIDEAVQAWKYGPVVQTVYQAFRGFRSSQITKMAQHETDGQTITRYVEDDKTKALLDKVWDVYSKYTGGQLSNLTHQDNTPWADTWHLHRGSERSGAVIPNQVIAEHYTRLANERKRPE
jgi:uncharacterized phage-associated protein